MLSNQQLATLCNKLQAPVVISEILDERCALTDEVQYALHEVISDLNPDSAVLCIALAARKIAGMTDSNAQTIPIMRMECDRIIEEYGEILIQAANENEEERGERVLEMLDVISEDLEGLTELLEFCSDFVFYDHKIIAELCSILQIQARAHALITEQFAMAVEAQGRHLIETLVQANTSVQAARENVVEPIAANTDNVIMFPFRPKGD